MQASMPQSAATLFLMGDTYVRLPIEAEGFEYNNTVERCHVLR
jgi:hypothetical protein